MDGMNIAINAITVALEELIKEGESILAEEERPDEMSEKIKVAVAAMKESVEALKKYMVTDDIDDLETVVRVMTTAAQIMGNPWETHSE
jgi:hypothetical protein